MSTYIVSRPGRPLHLRSRHDNRSWARRIAMRTLCGWDFEYNTRSWVVGPTVNPEVFARSLNAGVCHQCAWVARENSAALALAADLPRSK